MDSSNISWQEALRRSQKLLESDLGAGEAKIVRLLNEFLTKVVSTYELDRYYASNSMLSLQIKPCLECKSNSVYLLVDGEIDPGRRVCVSICFKRADDSTTHYFKQSTLCSVDEAVEIFGNYLHALDQAESFEDNISSVTSRYLSPSESS